ncbi:hypothetical protein FKM82_008667 [Ascaphus truei]
MLALLYHTHMCTILVLNVPLPPFLNSSLVADRRSEVAQSLFATFLGRNIFSHFSVNVTTDPLFPRHECADTDVNISALLHKLSRLLSL